MKGKRYFNLLLLLCALFALLTVNAAAADNVAGGTCGAESGGTNLSWTLDGDGVLTISGTGAMQDYPLSSNVPWYDHRTEIRTVKISSGVTSIGSGAFDGCGNLTDITIPSGITDIGAVAFGNCSSLKSIIVPDSVTSIGRNALRGCYSLESMTVPFTGCSPTKDTYIGLLFGTSTQTTQGEDVYHWIPRTLKTVVLSDACTSIGGSAFWYCSELTRITVPDSVKSIGTYAFYGCSGLKNIIIPNGVTSIPFDAFYGCSSLTSIAIPRSVTSIGKQAFFRCSRLVGVTIQGDVTSIGEGAFEYCSSLKSILLPDSMTVIEKNAFYGCGNLEGISLPITARCSDAFGGCDALTMLEISSANEVGRISDVFSGNMPKTFRTVLIADRCKAITDGAFDGCEQITSIKIGIGVKNIGEDAFSPCKNLTGIVVDTGNTAYSSDSYGVLFNKAKTELIQYPAGNSQEAYTIPASVTSISDKAFSGCSTLMGIMVDAGNTVYSSDSCGVLFNKAKTELIQYPVGNTQVTYTIPASVTSISDKAFFGCNALTGIAVDAGNTSYSSDSDGVLFNKSKTELICYPAGKSQTSCTISNGVTSIGMGAFYGCRNLTSITFPKSIVRIGDYAFYGCDRLSDVYYAGSTADWALIDIKAEHNSPLLEVTVYYDYNDDPGGIASGNCGANSDGKNLIWSLDSNGLLTISGTGMMKGFQTYSAVPWFGYASSITAATISSGVTSIENFAFYNCSNLKRVTVPDSVTYIGRQAFYGCGSLTSLTLPFVGERASNSLYTYLGYLFGASDCYDSSKIPTSLETVVLTDACKAIGNNAFYGCSSLTSITIPTDVTTIGSHAFNNCSGLTSIIIPASVTSIGVAAFYDCSGLTGITIPANVTSIGSNLFELCIGLESITVDAGNREYSSGDGVLFNKAKTRLIQYPAGSSRTAYTIPDGVTSIDERAFRSCSGLEHVTIPNSVTKIGNYAFFCCDSLTSVTIPDSVTSIGDHSFRLCSGLTSFTIGSGVKTIGTQALVSCTALERFIVAAGNSSYCSDNDGVLYTKDKSTLLSYPSARVRPYYNVAKETKTISSYAFYECRNLASVFVPRTVTTLKNSCIENSAAITVCIYKNTPADTYAKDKKLKSVAYMDSLSARGIEAYSLPQQPMQLGMEDFSALYVIVDYGDVKLPLDDYTISYSKEPGVQTVTVTGNVSGRTLSASFDIFLCSAADSQLVDFGSVEIPSGAAAYAAAYSADGQMLALAKAAVLNGTVQAAIPDTAYQSMKTAKLIILNSSSFAPMNAGKTVEKQ